MQRLPLGRGKKKRWEERRNRPFIRDVAHSQEDMRHEGTLGMCSLSAATVMPCLAGHGGACLLTDPPAS